MLLVTGATGFLGKRVCNKLTAMGIKFEKTSLSLGVDLRNKEATFALFEKVKPTYVLNCAAYVGGIQFGYKHPAELFSNNLLMTINLLEACKEFKVKRLVNPISNCAYPAKASLFKEKEFWEGELHDSVMVYGFARKAFWMGAWGYNKQYGLDTVNIILSNMYGPEDHFEEERSHALGALIMKFSKAQKENTPAVTVWGTGSPVREWLHVDDGAEAMIRSMDIAPQEGIVNIGVAKGVSIKELAQMIKDKVGYKGDMIFDTSKPDGAPYKTVDGTFGEKVFGWTPGIDLEKGISDTVEWYKKNVE